MSYQLKKGSAILTTIFLLFGIFVVSMIGIDIIMSGLAARRAQGASSRAFYAAESGAEQALAMYKLHGAAILADGNCNITNPVSLNVIAQTAPFCPGDDINNYALSQLVAGEAQPKYWVKERNASGAQIVTLNARGNYANTSRELYLNFCLPDCAGRVSGADDGCGGVCN